MAIEIYSVVRETADRLVTCQRLSRSVGRSLLLTLGGLSSVLVLASCASQPAIHKMQTQVETSAPAAPAQMADTAANPMGNVAKSPVKTAQVPAARPQLIKNAEISLVVKSVDEGMQRVSELVKQQQGDLLSFQDQRPRDGNTPRKMSLQIRVPQAQLESTLEALAKLGNLQSRSLQAEDVSSQLVDYQARLKNLRRSESVLLGIMERSGSVGDVLRAAQELSQVRESIEQIDAQLTNLRNRVAYSTIRLSLAEAIAATPPERNVSNQLQQTWNRSTRSLANFSVGMLKLMIWLLVYSPYLLPLVIAAIFFYNRSRRMTLRRSSQEPPAN